ncbi:tyrosine-type recombinase/integrase [Cytobacillus praedii]|uniref:Site-specific integrase n=1 Tax=Cytobacillus praedii TaxID=1742358 RepID=A0A4R1B1H3_9BACI|nr:tyrosine-type recombinase/integrase [Cytobacillus praedii]TCJ05055.1 site-specific integrase [Cytobacillus praedii]
MNVVQPIRDPDVIEAIKKYLKTRSLRNYLFFCFGIYSGLRVSDLLDLKVGMVRNTTHITMEETKNKHRKRFIIHPKIRNDLDRFISKKEDDEYLFSSRQIKKKTRLKGQPISRSTAYKILNDAARHFGLREIGTHTLRKTWGYQLYKQDSQNLALLMEMYGHTKPTDTLRYIGITQDMMDAAILKL